MNKLFLGLLATFFTINTLAQSTIEQDKVISLERAISIALERNHSIKIANNISQVSANNATIGNAGLLPSLSASGSYSGSIEDTELKFPGQPSAITDGAKSNTLSGSLSAGYVLFDGFGNYYGFQSLKKLEEQGGVEARLQIEGTLLQVISLYLGVITQKESLKITEESIERSLERYERVSKRYDLGNATRLDLLSSKVDLNSDSVALVQAQTNLTNAKRDLLIELGAEPDIDIKVVDKIEMDTSLKVSELLTSADQNNASVILSRLTAENAMLTTKQNRAGRFPKISISGSYDYLKNEADAGQFEFLKTTGFSGGISISLSLFNGFQQETRIQNAQVQLKNNQEAYELSQKALKRDVMNTYETYQTNLFLLDKEQLNLETALLNFDRSEQLFELGQITNTQFREAQLNVSRVQQNLLRLTIQAKLSEVSLYQLSGELIEIGK